MTTALLLLFTALLIALLIVAAISPNRARHSTFERKRRHEAGDDTRLDDLRERRYADVQTVLRIMLAVLFILLTLSAIGLLGWYGGPLAAALIAVVYGFLARLVPLRRFAQMLYDEQESALLGFLQANVGIFKWLRHDIHSSTVHGFDSKAELMHMIANDHGVLNEAEKQLLTGSLEFDDTVVGDIMTRQSDIFSIKKSEILGPLVLDDLHKSGHDSFPVTNSAESDDIVGILRLRDVQTLDTTRRHTAKVETAMDPDVRFITTDESLTTALNLLLSSQHHLLIVTDDNRSIVGLLTLNDIIKKLFGRKN